MPQKTKKKTTKNVPQANKFHPFLFGIIVGLIAIVVALMVVVRYGAEQMKDEPFISLGAMQYDFSGEKAVKRTDDTVKNLQSFLENLAQKDAEHECNSYYSVLMASDDETQVLLDYGCDHPGSRMFAVNEGGMWRTISPTNQFDLFGVPTCDQVNGNSISKTLAPVCVTWPDEAGASPVYSVRS